MAINDVFSKRGKALPDVFHIEDVPEALRHQIHWIWKDSLFTLGDEPPRVQRPCDNPHMRTVHGIVCREHGLASLTKERLRPEVDLLQAMLLHPDTAVVLDIIEASFFEVCNTPRGNYGSAKFKIRDVIAELNHRFLENGVGLQFDLNARRLIPYSETFTHEQAVRPALAVLARPDFATANKEFIDAFEDFKKSDFDDCLTKCCSCFESVMKIICDKKGWAYDQKDTASPLLDKIIGNTGMDSFFVTPLMLIATMRNRLSSSHGAGTTPKNPPEHIARYALNATASAILLLVEASVA